MRYDLALAAVLCTVADIEDAGDARDESFIIRTGLDISAAQQTHIHFGLNTYSLRKPVP